jgi:hypothetical protein
LNITNNEIVQNSKSEPKKFSILCTFNAIFVAFVNIFGNFLRNEHDVRSFNDFYTKNQPMFSVFMDFERDYTVGGTFAAKFLQLLEQMHSVLEHY